MEATETTVLTSDEFLGKVREKYPQYKDVPDEKLYGAMLTKYPAYKKTVAPMAVKQPAPVATAQPSMLDHAKQAVTGFVQRGGQLEMQRMQQQQQQAQAMQQSISKASEHLGRSVNPTLPDTQRQVEKRLAQIEQDKAKEALSSILPKATPEQQMARGQSQASNLAIAGPNPQDAKPAPTGPELSNAPAQSLIALARAKNPGVSDADLALEAQQGRFSTMERFGNRIGEQIVPGGLFKPQMDAPRNLKEKIADTVGGAAGAIAKYGTAGKLTGPLVGRFAGDKLARAAAANAISFAAGDQYSAPVDASPNERLKIAGESAAMSVPFTVAGMVPGRVGQIASQATLGAAMPGDAEQRALNALTFAGLGAVHSGKAKPTEAELRATALADFKIKADLAAQMGRQAALDIPIPESTVIPDVLPGARPGDILRYQAEQRKAAEPLSVRDEGLYGVADPRKMAADAPSRSASDQKVIKSLSDIPESAGGSGGIAEIIRQEVNAALDRVMSGSGQPGYSLRNKLEDRAAAIKKAASQRDQSLYQTAQPTSAEQPLPINYGQRIAPVSPLDAFNERINATPLDTEVASRRHAESTEATSQNQQNLARRTWSFTPDQPRASVSRQVQTEPAIATAKPVVATDASQPKRWFRGAPVDTVEGRSKASGDEFYSASKGTSEDYAGQGGKITKHGPEVMPKNPLRVESKEALAETMGESDPDNAAFALDFDAKAKAHALANGHDGILYENGSQDFNTGERPPELHVFKPILAEPAATTTPMANDTAGGVRQVLKLETVADTLTKEVGAEREAVAKGGFIGTKPAQQTQPYQSPDPAVEGFFKRTEKPTQDGPTIRERVASWVRGWQTPYVKLSADNSRADAREALRQQQDAKLVAGREAVKIVDGITHKLDRSEVDLLRRKAFLEDLIETAKDNAQDIPQGLTVQNVQDELARVNALVQAKPNVQNAYNKHVAVMNAVGDDLVTRGVITQEARDRHGRYIPHQVIDFMSNRAAPVGTGSKLKAPKEGYAKAREGSLRDISTDYLQVVYEHVAQVRHDQLTHGTIEKIASKYAAKPDANGNYPKTDPTGQPYVEWQPKQGNRFYQASTIPEQYVADAIAKAVQGAAPEARVPIDEIKTVLAVGGKRKTHMLPKDIADQLNALPTPEPASGLEKVTSYFKAWTLGKNPIRYNRNNMTGDMERLWTAMPSALRPSILKKAVADIYDFATTGRETPEWKQALERGVVTSGHVRQEVPAGTITDLPEFSRLSDKSLVRQLAGLPQDAWKAIWRLTGYREDFLRYAAFLHNMDNIGRGKPIEYGAAVPKEINALSDPIDRAAHVARETMADYGSVSHNGQKIRKSLIPFYSWLEKNTKFWPQVVKNQGAAGAGRGAVTAAAKGSLALAKTFTRLGAAYVAAYQWNNTGWRKEIEDTQSDETKRSMHIVVGRDDNGNSIVLRTPTALSDFLNWFGIDKAQPGIQRVMDNRMTWGEFAKQQALESGKAVANNVINRVSPIIKTPLELITGEKYGPDATNPRPIMDQDKAYYAVRSILGPEATSIIETVADKYPERNAPVRQRVADWAMSVTRSNPKVTAYFEARADAYNFAKKNGYEGFGLSPATPIMKRFKMALILDDKEKAKEYAKEIWAKGMTDSAVKSLDFLDPMRGVPTKLRRQFVEGLDERQKADQKDANAYYRELMKQAYAILREARPTKD